MRKRTAGYTFIELVIYTALLAVISVFVVNALLVTGKAFRKIQMVRATNASAESALERIVREIREARRAQIVTLGGVQELQLDKDNDGTFETLIRRDTGTIPYPSIAIQPAGPTVYLTSNRIPVTSLTFNYMPESGVRSASAVRVRMTINGKNFYATAVLRGSY
jgi:type II secretory pathway pseudopilin PulG